MEDRFATMRQVSDRLAGHVAPRWMLAARRRRNLALLADRLIARHVRIAVRDRGARDQLVEGGAGYDREYVERTMHCVAVVGAGASASLLKRSDALADELEAKFGRDEAELERLRLVNNLEEATFETRLVALSKSPDVERKVREKVAEMYRLSFPSLLGYELLAHLLKHRFIDAIVSFNFDELLDQSLDDELDENEYVRIISERDCADIECDPGADDYVPLYVKLHGTASEPESLRYTPQSYYALPPRLLDVVRDLLHSEHCVIANIGSNLGSFDFQRLLAIPGKLEVFNLSWAQIPATVSAKIESERAASRATAEGDGAQRNGGPPLAGRLLGSAANGRDPDWLFDCNGWNAGSDELMSELTATIDAKVTASTDGLVEFRSVRRHRTISRLLGQETVDRRWMDDPAWARREWTEYCRRRTILELAFAGTKARGLMSLVPLTTDRPARSFSRYRQLTSGRGDDWRTFCSAAGLVESDETPDVLHSQRRLRRDQREAGKPPADRRLNEFDTEMLARHVLTRVKNPVLEDDVRALRATFDELQTESDVEFHMRDDRVCSKAFERPATLPTATSLRAYTWLMLKPLTADDDLHVCSETGAWLLRPEAERLLARVGSIRILLAFDVDRDKLEEMYGGRIKVAVVDPWRHNRHMTIVCRDGRPWQAIYFARRLRTPVITAVYLREARDVERLMRLYDERWGEVVSFDFGAFKEAIEARDVTRLMAFYAQDAEWVGHRQTAPLTRPRTLRGRERIARHIREVAAVERVYSFSDEVVNPDRIAFAITESGPGDEHTRRHVHLNLAKGLITSRIDVEVRHEGPAPWSGDAGN